MEEKRPIYMAQTKNSGITGSLVIEVSFIADILNSWCVYFGAINHICNTLQKFRKTKKLSNGEIMLHLVLEARVVVVSIGVV